MYNFDVKFIINIINITYGRILGIISNTQQKSNQTKMLEVTMDLGK
jgi:hypothetical protein